MPLFVFISGYFSKILTTGNDYKKLIKTLLIPYVILEFFYGFTDSLLYGGHFSATLLYPNWGMWYLLSLFTWRLLLNIVIQYKFALYILIVIGLLIGYDKSVTHTLSFSRTLVFFPFFYAGYLLAEKKIDLSFLTRYRIWGLLILVCIFLLFYASGITINPKWFYGSYAYAKLDEPLYGIIYRLILYVVAVIMGLAFLTIVPSGKTIYTKVGKNTMNVYIWHFLLLDILTSSGFYKKYKLFIADHHMLMLFVFVFAAILIVFVLSSKFIEKYFSLHNIGMRRKKKI